MSGGWDERLFGVVHRWWRAARGPAPVDPHAVPLDAQRRRLELLAGAIAGFPIAIRVQHPARPGLSSRDGGLHVPALAVRGGSVAANEQSYVLRVVLGASALATGERAPPCATAAALHARWAAHGAALAARWPGFAPLWSAWQPRLARWADEGDLAALFDVLGQWPGEDATTPADAAAGGLPAAGARAARPAARLAETPELRHVEERTPNPMLHNFEKLETVEEYGGGSRTLDGRDELAAHGEALAEIAFDQVIRTRETAQTMLESDVDVALPPARLEAATDASAARELRYPEWSVRAQRYLADWCRVVETADEPAAAAAVAPPAPELLAQARRLRVAFETLRNRYEWERRRHDGPELDLDAAVRRAGDLARGTTPEDRLWLRRRRLERDLVTLVLVDRSLSTDAWVGGRRVGAVIADALCVLGTALDGLDARVEIAAFCSNTRQDCRYAILKAFDAPWRPVLAALPESLRAEGYTRIGPALRHATARLAAVPARRRALFVVSDSRPTDYDAYEGTHGLADVARAVEEARGRRIAVRGFAVAASRRAHFEKLYGSGQYVLLHDRDSLGAKLFEAHLAALRARL
ncbi:MAG: hypothetical protein HY749_12800 [Gammaproteobacteria bacterium]|nr:hypothetical protein [Gammaproteobacteria bacterium]